MSRNEFHAALRHLTNNPQDIIFFEEGLKEFALALNQQEDHYWDLYTNYWEINRFIVACWDIAEAQGAFNHLDKEAK